VKTLFNPHIATNKQTNKQKQNKTKNPTIVCIHNTHTHTCNCTVWYFGTYLYLLSSTGGLVSLAGKVGILLKLFIKCTFDNNTKKVYKYPKQN
jgi:hypothetical protein